MRGEAARLHRTIPAAAAAAMAWDKWSVGGASLSVWVCDCSALRCFCLEALGPVGSWPRPLQSSCRWLLGVWEERRLWRASERAKRVPRPQCSRPLHLIFTNVQHLFLYCMLLLFFLNEIFLWLIYFTVTGECFRFDTTQQRGALAR